MARKRHRDGFSSRQDIGGQFPDTVPDAFCRTDSRTRSRSQLDRSQGGEGNHWLGWASVKTRLGAGELSSIFLSKELPADLLLLDESRARRYAQIEGLAVAGCIGILEDLYERGELSDLRAAYQELIRNKTRVDLRTLQHSPAKFKLLPL